jgi:hypothetical protein
MKNIAQLSLILFLGFFACKDPKKSENVVANEPIIKPYAEISIKEGGVWQDGPRNHKEYVGGTFKNVEELVVPAEHTDHTWYIRYEGPGWENKQVGYRLYLDWRNAIDIFGKKVDTIVLPYVGQDGFDSYHEMSDWGLDILKAGKSLGIGSYGRFVNGEVLHFNTVEKTTAKVFNTDKASGVDIHYKNWVTANDSIDLSSKLSIFSEGRHTKVELTASKAIDGISTGIVKLNQNLVQKSGKNWGYIATYGAQTLVNDTDKLGMAVFYKLSETQEITDGEHDHLVVFKANTNYTYYFLGAWEQELNGITNQADFEANLNDLLTTLDTNDRLE